MDHPYNYWPTPVNENNVVGYDEQGNRRVRVRVPKNKRSTAGNSISTTAEMKIPERILETDTTASEKLPRYRVKTNEIPQPSETQPYSYSTKPETTETTVTPNNITPDGSYIDSYSTFSSGVTLITNTVPPETTVNTYTTMVERPNGITRVRMKVRKNKDGSRTIIGAAPREQNPAFNNMNPNYRDRDLPPKRENDRVVEEINGEKLYAADSEAVRPLNLNINHAVPYQQSGAYNYVANRNALNPQQFPENFRVNIPANSRFAGTDATTMESATTLESDENDQNLTESSFKTTVSRDLPTFWQSENDIDDDFIKLEIGAGTYTYLDDELIRQNLERQEQEEIERERQRQIAIAERNALYEELSKRQIAQSAPTIDDTTPYYDMLKEKPWKFIPRNRRMHNLPPSAEFELDTNVSYESANLTAYGIYMPSAESSLTITEDKEKESEIKSEIYGEIANSTATASTTSSIPTELLDWRNLQDIMKKREPKPSTLAEPTPAPSIHPVEEEEEEEEKREKEEEEEEEEEEDSMDHIEEEEEEEEEVMEIMVEEEEDDNLFD